MFFIINLDLPDSVDRKEAKFKRKAEAKIHCAEEVEALKDPLVRTVRNWFLVIVLGVALICGILS